MELVDALASLVEAGIFLAIGVALGALGATIGAKKNASGIGFVLGFLLGPLGILTIALAFDRRRKCPICEHLYAGRPGHCENCMTSFSWETTSDDPIVTTAPVKCPECGARTVLKPSQARLPAWTCLACGTKVQSRRSPTRITTWQN